MRSKSIFIILSTTLLLLLLIDFSLGTSLIPISKIAHFLSFKLSSSDEHYLILNTIRLPRILAVVASGICISLSGLLMQTFFKNPLAGPYVLGISSGATLGAAVFIMSYPFLQSILPESVIAFGISGFAILGAMFFMLIIFLVSLRIQESLTVLIAGILLGTTANALINLIQYSSGSLELKSFVLWNMGNINNTFASISMGIIFIGLFCIIILIYFSKWFDIWVIGEVQASSLGINKNKFTFITFAITATLTGLSTAFYGPIAFIGLISPHIARIITNTNIHLKLIPTTLLVGICLLLIADILLQFFAIIFSGALLPLNTITSLLSAPILVYFFIKKRELWM